MNPQPTLSPYQRNHATLCAILMIRFYSIFVTDEDLFESPYVRRFNTFHDLILHRGKTVTVNFLLQTALTNKQQKRLRALYDPLVLTLQKVEVTPYAHQTLLTVTLTPKELGSIRLGFSYPEKSIHTTFSPPPVRSPLSSTPISHDQPFPWR